MEMIHCPKRIETEILRISYKRLEIIYKLSSLSVIGENRMLKAKLALTRSLQRLLALISARFTLPFNLYPTIITDGDRGRNGPEE